MVKGVQRTIGPSPSAAGELANKFLFLGVDTQNRPTEPFILSAKFGQTLELFVAVFTGTERDVLGDLPSPEPQ